MTTPRTTKTTKTTKAGRSAGRPARNATRPAPAPEIDEYDQGHADGVKHGIRLERQRSGRPAAQPISRDMADRLTSLIGYPPENPVVDPPTPPRSAGRPRLAPDQKRVKLCLTVPPDAVELLSRLATISFAGNTSRLVEYLIRKEAWFQDGGTPPRKD